MFLIISAVFGRLGTCVWYFADLQSCHRNNGAPGFRTLSASHSGQQSTAQSDLRRGSVSRARTTMIASGTS